MPYFRNLALFVCFLGAVGWNAPAQDKSPALPDGEGKDLVQRVCTGCHDLDTALDQTRSEAQWKSVVDTMAGRGAEATDKEFDMIVKYLAKNFGSRN